MPGPAGALRALRLLGLRRLQRRRDRRGPAARLPGPGELRPAVLEPEPHRVLEALAHHALRVDPRPADDEDGGPQALAVRGCTGPRSLRWRSAGSGTVPASGSWSGGCGTASGSWACTCSRTRSGGAGRCRRTASGSWETPSRPALTFGFVTIGWIFFFLVACGRLGLDDGAPSPGAAAAPQRWRRARDSWRARWLLAYLGAESAAQRLAARSAARAGLGADGAARHPHLRTAADPRRTPGLLLRAVLARAP